MHGCRHCCRPFYVGPCYLAEWSYSERDFSSHYSPYLDHDFPMMMEVDFESIRSVGKNPKGLFVTWIVNWLVKPFSMYLVASFFLMVLFRSLISTDLARQYLAGAVLLGAAPCTAMVFVWSTLTKGDPAYTVVQVATNDLIILVAFIPIVRFLLGVSQVAVPYGTLFLSVILFVLIPLVVGTLTRLMVTWRKGIAYFESVFLPRFDHVTMVGLLLTLVIILPLRRNLSFVIRSISS